MPMRGSSVNTSEMLWQHPVVNRNAPKQPSSSGTASSGTNQPPAPLESWNCFSDATLNVLDGAIKHLNACQSSVGQSHLGGTMGVWLCSPTITRADQKQALNSLYSVCPNGLMSLVSCLLPSAGLLPPKATA